MNTIEILELSDAELDVAAAGKMNCDTAVILHDIYALACDVLQAFGNMTAATFFHGKADGALDNGCGVK